MSDPNDATPDRPLVSFVLIAYNQENYVREAISGAFAQTYVPLEIILSDDCSTDRTFEIMQESASRYVGPGEILVRRNERNLGLAEHINAVVASARGEIICWAAGDDISLPERTKLLVEPMLRDPCVIGTHSRFHNMDLHGAVHEVANRDSSIREYTVEKIIRHGYKVVSQTHAFRKYVFDFFGPILASVTNEGAIMAFREAVLGKIVFIDQPTILYRIGSGTSTYSGRDSRRLKYHEPVKVVGWSLGFYDQLMMDLPRAGVERALPGRRVKTT